MSEPTLTVTQTGVDAPADAAASAPPPDQFSDSLGRRYVLKKPSMLDQYRLVKILGDVPDRYLNMVVPLIWVVSMDGQPIAKPNSQREVDAFIQTLGEEGVNTVMLGVEALAKAAGTAVDEAVKNS